MSARGAKAHVHPLCPHLRSRDLFLQTSFCILKHATRHPAGVMMAQTAPVFVLLQLFKCCCILEKFEKALSSLCSLLKLLP